MPLQQHRPRFITTGEPHDDFHDLADGTRVGIEIVAIDPAATLRINDHALREAGASALLGTVPGLHVHPSWQLLLPDGMEGEFSLTFKLTADGGGYADSAPFGVVLTNRMAATPTGGVATATPTVGPPECPGDCNADGVVGVDELVRGVRGVLGAPFCVAFDLDRNGRLAVSELVSAVAAALGGCPTLPTPTAAPPATLEEIQHSIFSPRCALPTCHDVAPGAGNLLLAEGEAHAQLVGVPPDVFTAREAGLLRVDPGRPQNSFLLVKLLGPPPDQGRRMPLGGDPLTAAQVALIRRWIDAGAQP